MEQSQSYTSDRGKWEACLSARSGKGRGHTGVLGLTPEFSYARLKISTDDHVMQLAYIPATHRNILGPFSGHPSTILGR